MNTTDSHVHESGLLDVEHYKIYWEDWRNRDTTPIFFLHGGPGGSFDDYDKELFDPKQHRVIFHDQRGGGKSEPFADTVENRTQDLIEDIERLRLHLGFKKIHVVGGSWGSALSLFYTIAHPENVERLVIWSIFLVRQFEVDFANEGYPRYFFPEVWERFISLVPEEHRTNGDSIMAYDLNKIHSMDEAEALKHANEWVLWECTICSFDYKPVSLEKIVFEGKSTLALARLEGHYLSNKCFVSENYIFDNLDKITHIPCAVIQGRFDMCTPPVSSTDLQKAYGENLTLRWVNAGHLICGEKRMLEAVRGS